MTPAVRKGQTARFRKQAGRGQHRLPPSQRTGGQWLCQVGFFFFGFDYLFYFVLEPHLVELRGHSWFCAQNHSWQAQGWGDPMKNQGSNLGWPYVCSEVTPVWLCAQKLLLAGSGDPMECQGLNWGRVQFAKQMPSPMCYHTGLMGRVLIPQLGCCARNLKLLSCPQINLFTISK